MIGKLFVPLAIGGGLVFLLASSAGASQSSGSAQKNPFDQLPNNLRQLARQAQATNDPNMLEQVAAQLEAQRFRDHVGEHHFASKYEQPARGEAVGGLFLCQLTGQVVGSGSVGSFLRERRSLA